MARGHATDVWRVGNPMRPVLRCLRLLFPILGLYFRLLFPILGLYVLLDQFGPLPIGRTLCHARYGCYPQTVPYREGMTILPKQTAVFLLVVPVRPTEDPRPAL